MSGSVQNKIRKAVDDYAKTFQLSATAKEILFDLALVSYKNMPRTKKHLWTLEQVVIQRL